MPNCIYLSKHEIVFKILFLQTYILYYINHQGFFFHNYHVVLLLKLFRSCPLKFTALNWYWAAVIPWIMNLVSVWERCQRTIILNLSGLLIGSGKRDLECQQQLRHSACCPQPIPWTIFYLCWQLEVEVAPEIDWQAWALNGLYCFGIITDIDIIFSTYYNINTF